MSITTFLQRLSNTKVLLFISSLPILGAEPYYIITEPLRHRWAIVVTKPLHHRQAITSSPSNRAVAEPPDRHQPNRPPRSQNIKKSQLYDDVSYDIRTCIKNHFSSSSTISKKGRFWFLYDLNSLAFISSKLGNQWCGQDDALKTLLLCLHYLPLEHPPPR